MEETYYKLDFKLIQLTSIHYPGDLKQKGALFFMAQIFMESHEKWDQNLSFKGETTVLLIKYIKYFKITFQFQSC